MCNSDNGLSSDKRERHSVPGRSATPGSTLPLLAEDGNRAQPTPGTAIAWCDLEAKHHVEHYLLYAGRLFGTWYDVPIVSVRL